MTQLCVVVRTQVATEFYYLSRANRYDQIEVQVVTNLENFHSLLLLLRIVPVELGQPAAVNHQERHFWSID